MVTSCWRVHWVKLVVQHKEGAQQQHEDDEPCERIVTHIRFSSADCHSFLQIVGEQVNSAGEVPELGEAFHVFEATL